jgi:hypothetical protein
MKTMKFQKWQKNIATFLSPYVWQAANSTHSAHVDWKFLAPPERVHAPISFQWHSIGEMRCKPSTLPGFPRLWH